MSRRVLRLLSAAVVAASLAAVFAGTALANPVLISGSMEGAIKVSPGDWLAGGYSFTFPGGAPQATLVQFMNAQVTLTGPCTNGGTDTVTIPLSGGPYNVPANDSNWWPSGAGNSYQGAVQAPANLCGGAGQLDASKGAVFTGDLQASDTSAKINIRFHYRDPAAKGKANVDCTSGTYPSDVCNSSWSGTASYTGDVVVPVAMIGGIVLAVLLAGGLLFVQQKRRRTRTAATLLRG